MSLALYPSVRAVQEMEPAELAESGTSDAVDSVPHRSNVLRLGQVRHGRQVRSMIAAMSIILTLIHV